MSDLNYPEWGMFGTAKEDCASTPDDRPERQQDKDNGGSQVDLTYEIEGVKITTNEKDSPEQIKAAIQAAHDQAARSSAPTLRGYKHTLRGAIESAIKNAGVSDLSQDSVMPVWNALVSISESEQSGVMVGFAPKGIKYRGSKWQETDGQDYDYYTSDALALAFKRQRDRDRKAESNPP